MEKTEDVNQTFRDENQELMSANEILNITNQTFQRKILVREDQLKKRFPIPFTAQRNPNFLILNNLVEFVMSSNFSNSISEPKSKPTVIGLYR